MQSHDASPRDDLNQGMNSLNRQYSAPGWPVQILELEQNHLGFGHHDEPHSFMDAFHHV